MAEVIFFEDIIRAKRRAQAHDVAERCTEIIQLNLRLALELFDAAPPEERPLYARRIRHLGVLLDYAVGMQ